MFLKPTWSTTSAHDNRNLLLVILFQETARFRGRPTYLLPRQSSYWSALLSALVSPGLAIGNATRDADLRRTNVQNTFWKYLLNYSVPKYEETENVIRIIVKLLFCNVSGNVYQKREGSKRVGNLLFVATPQWAQLANLF